MMRMTAASENMDRSITDSSTSSKTAVRLFSTHAPRANSASPAATQEALMRSMVRSC